MINKERVKELIYILKNDGDGCICYAYGRHECACNAKWAECYFDEIAIYLKELIKKDK